MPLFNPIVARRLVALQAMGMLAETYPTIMQAENNGAASASQRINSMLLTEGLLAGDVVTSIVLGIGIAGAGTAPTMFKVGLLSKTGTVLETSSNLKDSALLTSQGIKAFPLSAPFTVLTSDIYYACFLQDGVFGTTPLQVNRSAAVGANNVTTPSGLRLIAEEPSKTDITGTVVLSTGGTSFWAAVA